MKALVLVLSAGVMLAGCANVQQTQNFTSIVQELKHGCHVTVSFQARGGPMNPSSGVDLQGSADCPVAAVAPAVP